MEENNSTTTHFQAYVIVMFGFDYVYMCYGRCALLTTQARNNRKFIRRELEKLTDINWGMLVIDEAQAIKNSDAAQSKAVKSLSAPY
jgi:hypothetical protein